VMIACERWGLLITFNYRNWRDMVHAGYALYAASMLLCEWLWPGWAASVGLSPHVNWSHPERWLHTWMYKRL
jgi:hypothetical protein